MSAAAAPPRRILAVFNPAAGGNRRARFEAVRVALQHAGCAVTVRETTAPGDAEGIARTVDLAAFDVIAAGGGDGTVNEIVNGLRGREIALGIIPLGTANVLADEIGIRRDTAAIVAALTAGPVRPIRTGLLNGRRFVMMAGVGFDANVVANVSLPLKKRIGPLAYVWQALVQGMTDPYAACDVVLDGVAARATSVVVCNGRRYGGPFIAAPQADLADDWLHVILMKGRGSFSVLRYGIGLILGKVALWGDVEIIRARAVTVTGTAGQAVQADGDIVAALPVTIAVDPEPLRVVFPPA